MSSFKTLETHAIRVTKQTELTNSKKVLLGPPDVYPQEIRQKEDLLSEFNVREGFSYSKPVAEEYESAKKYGVEFVSQSAQLDINDFIQSVLTKHHVYNVKQDTTRRKPVSASSYKELNYIPALDKNKDLTSDWMRNLSNCTPYSELIAKRIPYFHKKEDVLKELIRFKVLMTSAVWFIKITAMLTTIQAESNKKKTRSTVDNSTDWMHSFERVLNEKFDLIMKKVINEVTDHDYEIAADEFDYLIQLVIAMFDGDLLDHTEILNWFVDHFEMCINHEQKLKFFLPFLLQFGSDRFCESEIVSRRILFYASRAFRSLVDEDDMSSCLSQYASCQLHRCIVLQLSGLLASLSLYIPSAIIWNDIKDPQNPLHGSPLDSLPCILSSLPLVLGADDGLYREYLQDLEQFVLRRSKLADLKWNLYDLNKSIDNSNNSLVSGSSVGCAAATSDSNAVLSTTTTPTANTDNCINKEVILSQAVSIIYTLDHFDYSICRDENAIEIMATNLHESCRNDDLLLYIICQWSVHPSRTGHHRPLVAVRILEYLINNKENKMQPHFANLQSGLTNFLDTAAPIIDVNNSIDSESFRNLVCLFGELIDREMFSSSDYISYMIARGLFDNTNQLPFLGYVTNNSSGFGQVKSPSDPERTPNENPDSNRSDQSLITRPQTSQIDYKLFPRHIQFLTHFPIPHNDDYLHEHNLRAQKLYQSARARNAHDAYLKKLTKDASKLFNRRALCFDIIQSEKSRRKPRGKEENMNYLENTIDSVFIRFKSLSYYDMEVVLTNIIPMCLTAINFHSILSNEKQNLSNMFLPHPKSINMLLNMLELSTNYSSLIEFIDKSIQNLAHLIDYLFAQKVTSCISHFYSYTSQYRQYIVSQLVKYHSILLLLPSDIRVGIIHTMMPVARNPLFSSMISNNNHINLSTYAFVVNMVQSCIIVKNHKPMPQLIKKLENFFSIKIEPDYNRSSHIEYNENLARETIKSPPILFQSTERFSTFITELRTNPHNSLSFVVNCILHLAKIHDPEQIYRLNMFIVDNIIQSEWMSAFFSLLMPLNCTPGYEQFSNNFHLLLLSNDLNFFDNISLLIATLLAKNCFTFCNFLSNVLCVALAQNLEQHCDLNPKITPTTRLASYILHKLFTLDFYNNNNNSYSSNSHNAATDLNFLTYSLQKVTIELLVDLLKMLAVHSDRNRSSESLPTTAGATNSAVVSIIGNNSNNSNCNTNSNSATNQDPFELNNPNLLTMKIGNLTLRVLREICSLPWVRMKFIKEKPSDLIRDNVLIDKNTSQNQSRNLLNIICNPRDYVWRTSYSNSENCENITKILANLSLWSFHLDLMRIQFFLTQISDEDQRTIINSVTKDVVHLFHTCSEQLYKNSLDDNNLNCNFENNYNNNNNLILFDNSFDIDSLSSIILNINSTYLIPLLIEKLPFDTFKRCLIEATAEKLESGKLFHTHKNCHDKEKDLLKSSLILSYSPFISLLRFCLTNENKMDFLKSLSEQIESYIENAKETERLQPDDLKVKQLIHQALRCKLSFVGLLFDKIQDSTEYTGDWCLLLSKLIIYGIVEAQSDHCQLFYTVLDMVSTLVHTLHANTTFTQRAQQFMKRLRKEIADKITYENVEHLKPLLMPCFKNSYEFIVTAPLRVGANRLQNQSKLCDAERSGKEGCFVVRKEKMNPWEVIEGIKGLFPLSAFAGVTSCNSTLPIEDQANILIGHTHLESFKRSEQYYLSNPEYPIEESVPGDNASICSSSNPPSVSNNSMIMSNDNCVLNKSQQHPQSNLSGLEMSNSHLHMSQMTSNTPNNVNTNSNTITQPLIRTHSNASTASSSGGATTGGAPPTKRAKRTKRTNNNNANNTNNNCVSNNNILQQNMNIQSNPTAMIIRQPNPSMSMPPQPPQMMSQQQQHHQLMSHHHPQTTNPMMYHHHPSHHHATQPHPHIMQPHMNQIPPNLPQYSMQPFMEYSFMDQPQSNSSQMMSRQNNGPMYTICPPGNRQPINVVNNNTGPTNNVGNMGAQSISAQQPRPPRSTQINQNLKSKIQQRQPTSSTGATIPIASTALPIQQQQISNVTPNISQSHGETQSLVGLPPPYPGSSTTSQSLINNNSALTASVITDGTNNGTNNENIMLQMHPSTMQHSMMPTQQQQAYTQSYHQQQQHALQQHHLHARQFPHPNNNSNESLAMQQFIQQQHQQQQQQQQRIPPNQHYRYNPNNNYNM